MSAILKTKLISFDLRMGDFIKLKVNSLYGIVAL